MKLASFFEGATIALSAIRVHKLRSALTILGVVIGVSTVMAMASIVAGMREQIVNTLEVVGPTTFRILRFFSQTPLDPNSLPREVRIRPVLHPDEGKAIARLPQIHYSAIWTQVFERLEYESVRTQLTAVFGADDQFMEILGARVIQWMAPPAAIIVAPGSSQSMPITLYPGRASSSIFNPIVSHSSLYVGTRTVLFTNTLLA